MKLPIYLDYNATTPVDPEVLEAMLPYFTERFGNASSKSHEFGWVAEAAVEKARAQVALLLAAHVSEVFFTGGATESNNLAIRGVALAYQEKGRHLITTRIEHHAVLGVFEALQREGFEVTWLEADHCGRISPEDLERAIRKDTTLISVMTANNEVGTIEPIEAVGKIAKARGIIFHTDATQAISKIPVDVNRFGVDLVSLTAHKIYGPKGVGALYVRRKNPRVSLEPLIFGGGQENGIRSGTLNVPGIVGLGKASELARLRRAEDTLRLGKLRDQMTELLSQDLQGLQIHGHPTERLPDNLSIGFEGVDAQALMLAVREIAVSTGSACMSADHRPSHVLKAMGIDEELIRGTIRISVGRTTTEDEVRFAAKKLIEKIKEFRLLQ